MATIQTKACDYPDCPNKADGVESYTIHFPDGRLDADLCVDHSATLKELRSKLGRRLFRKMTSRQMSSRRQTGITAADVDEADI